jgi:hypothetical protein
LLREDLLLLFLYLGIPDQLVLDAGSENTAVRDVQIALRAWDSDSKAGFNSVRIVRSTANQVCY